MGKTLQKYGNLITSVIQKNSPAMFIDDDIEVW